MCWKVIVKVDQPNNIANFLGLIILWGQSVSGHVVGYVTEMNCPRGTGKTPYRE